VHIGNIGGLIWVVVLIAGVISSIRKSQKQARVAAAPQTVVRPPIRVAVREPAPVPARTIERSLPTKPAPMIERPAPPPPIVHDHDMEVPTGVPRRLFEDRRSLIWAVVMSEVLGQPKALSAEQHLWSLQHQPPST